MGGSSAINGQIAIRPPLEDFDMSARAGCHGWSATEVLPAFIKLEMMSPFGDQPYHGRGGANSDLSGASEEWGAVDRALDEASSECGYGHCADHNAPSGAGQRLPMRLTVVMAFAYRPMTLISKGVADGEILPIARRCDG